MNLIGTHNSDILFFMETKLNSYKANHMIRKLNFPFFIEIPTNGFAGGFVVDVEKFCDVVSSSNRFIH